MDEEHVFKRGIVYRGVYCPSLSNSFRELHLELAYQRYTHRQRQKSLIIVNFVDALLKIVLAVVRKQSTVLTLIMVAQHEVKTADVRTSKHLSYLIYRVIHKSLRDFRTRLRNNQDRHGRKEHINR